MELIETDSLVNQDISSPLLISSYTADESRLLLIQVYLGDIAGDDIYKMCITKQDGGAGTMYQSPTSFSTVELGTTTVYLLSEIIPVEENDVIRVYAEGTALDTLVDTEVNVFSYDESLSDIILSLTSISSSLKQYSVMRRHMKCDQIEIRRSTDASVEVYGVGDLTGRSKLYFTVKYMKEKDSATDAQAVIQIEETAGLLYINQNAAETPANGSITVTDALAGTMTIELSAEETDKLLPNERYVYDIKMDNEIMAEGTLLVTTAVTRTVT